MDDLTFADAFADRAHAGQVRKGGDIPYIVHPREVSAILHAHYPGDYPLRIAGLLHDVVEDTVIKIDVIGILYGDRVANLVWSVTNTRPGYDLSEVDFDALRLKAADLLANIIDTQRDIEGGHFVWPRFVQGRGKVAVWDRQTRIIENRLLNPMEMRQVLGRRNDDRDLVERLRARVDIMLGLANIVTDAEKNFIAAATPEQMKPPPVELHG